MEKYSKKGSVSKDESYASELWYRLLFESTKDGILILDAKTGKIVDVNPFLIDLLGYSKKELIEKTIWEIGAFQDIIENIDKFQELKQKEYVRYEDLPLETSDGRKIHVEFVSNVLLVNNTKVIQCNIRDITERKEIEAVLEKTRKELAKIKTSADELNEFTENMIDTVREPLLAIDKDLRVIKASSSFYNFFRVSAEETIGKLIYELGNHQWDIPKLKELLDKIIPEKNSFDNYEVEHTFSTIGKRVMLLNARQVKSAFGKEKIILLAIEDITERKAKEDSLQETQRETSVSLNSLLDHMHTPIIIWDNSMIIKRFNHKFELLSGYDSAEVIGRKIDFLFPKEKIAATLELLKNHLDDEQDIDEIDILTKDNHIKTVLWNSSRILDEEGNNIIATISQDITSRKLSEDALNFSETRYRRLFESAKDGILILDAETGKIVDVNPFLIDLLGYTKQDFTDKSIWEIGSFRDFYENKEKFLELQQKEYVRYDDLPLATSDGREIHVEFVSNVYLVNNSKVIQCNIRDITERKKVEELLQESEERYRSFFENSIDGILLTRPDGKIISANLAACKMLGYNENELINLGRTGIVDTSDPKLSFLLTERAAKGKARCELTFIHKDGTKFPCEISSAIFKNRDGIEHTSMIIRDISERKQIQQKIKDSEKRFRAIFDQAPIAIALIDTQGNIRISNLGLSKMIGYSLDELSKLKFTDFTYPEDIDKDMNSFTDLINGKINSYTMEKRYIHKNRAIVWVNISVSLLRDVSGNIIEILGMAEDITERKQAEEKLKNSEEKFKILFDYAPDAYYLTDLKGTFIDGNIAAEKMLGYSKIEMIGKNFFKLKLISPNQFLKATTLLAENLLGKATGPNEFVIKHKNGSEITVEISSYPIKIQDQSIVLGIARDISGRKQAEKEIAMLAHSLKSINECVSITDLEDKIIFVNQAFLDNYGYKLKELIGKPISLVHSTKNEQNQVSEILPATIRGEWHGELFNKRKDGSEFTVYLSTTVVKDKDNKILGLIGVATDITERKNSENKLKESEEKFKTITENSADAIFITDKEGKYIYVNKQAVDLLGYSKEELLKFTIADITPKNRMEEYFQIFQQLFITSSSYSEIELVKKDGSYVDTDLNTVQLPNGWIYGSCRDISERKKLENELIKAKERAEESDRLKTAFLNNVSHEIRTPLNAIMGFSGFLNDPDLKPEKRQEFTDIILQSSDQLLAIIDDIIRIASIEAGQEKIQENQININLVCDLIKEQFSSKANEKDVRLSLKSRLTDDEAIIITDATKLTQILTNLISNALKFTQHGYINYGYKVKDSQLEFYVEDSGIGIQLDMQKIIFDRFRQVETTATRNFGGSGLGLSISKAYVEMLGGKMWLTSELDKGSVFYFTIPYNNATPKKLPEIPTIKGLNFGFNTTKTLLIAEDQDSNFMVLEAMLSHSGINIIRVENGLEAVKLCKSNPHIDLVLMDLKMPVMDGYEATTQIKEFKPDLPIIAQTAYITEADRSKALACGCSDHISKPIKKQLLLFKINEQLHK